MNAITNPMTLFSPAAAMRRPGCWRVGLFVLLLAALPIAQAAPPASAERLPAGWSAGDWQAIRTRLPAAVEFRTTADEAVQQAYLKADNAEAGAFFGYSVAASGDTAVVGAPTEGGEAGAAYVFVRNASGGWDQQAYLKADNAEAGDYFGVSVAIDGDTLVVGADSESGPANGISESGAAYVFVRSGTTWSQQAYI